MAIASPGRAAHDGYKARIAVLGVPTPKQIACLDAALRRKLEDTGSDGGRYDMGWYTWTGAEARAIVRLASAAAEASGLIVVECEVTAVA